MKANLIENPSFEQTWSRDGESQRFVTAWQMFMMEYDHLPDPGFGRTGESCFVMRHEDAGDPWRAVGQSIFVTQKTPLQLELSCWVAGARPPCRGPATGSSPPIAHTWAQFRL